MALLSCLTLAFSPGDEMDTNADITVTKLEGTGFDSGGPALTNSHVGDYSKQGGRRKPSVIEEGEDYHTQIN